MYDLKDQEMIFVFTGPDGSGRKTIANLVAQSTLQMKGVISYTTRPKRSYEVEGRDYYFITDDEFRAAKEEGEFLESVRINGYQYGIKEMEVKKRFQEKGCIYLVLNTEGAQIMKDLYGNKVVRLFIYADRQTLRERQVERGDASSVIAKHLAHYDEDMAYKAKCEHAFENSKLDHTAYEVTQAVESYLN